MFKVVMVKWEDPCFSSDGWMPTQHFFEWVKDSLPETVLVGVLVHEDESFIVISQSFGERQIADSIKDYPFSNQRMQGNCTDTAFC